MQAGWLKVAIISTCKRMWPFIWTNLRSLPSRMLNLCQAWLRYWSSGSMHVSSMYLYLLFTAWKGRGHNSFKKNFRLLYPRILSAKFGWYWPGGLEKILKCGQHWQIQEFQNWGRGPGAVEFLGSEICFDASFKHTLCSGVRVENKVHIVNIVWWLQLEYIMRVI